VLLITRNKKRPQHFQGRAVGKRKVLEIKSLLGSHYLNRKTAWLWRLQAERTSRDLLPFEHDKIGGEC